MKEWQKSLVRMEWWSLSDDQRRSMISHEIRMAAKDILEHFTFDRPTGVFADEERLQKLCLEMAVEVMGSGADRLEGLESD